MRIRITTPILAGALALGVATSALAATGQFDDMCAMGLATGQEIKTDCSVNASYEGKTYCFGNEEAKTKFMKNPAKHLTKAEKYYSEHHG